MSLILHGFFFNLIYLSVIYLRDQKKKKTTRRQIFLFLECFCSGNVLHKADNIHSERHIMAKPWALWECRGGGTGGRWHYAPPFGGTDLLFFVLAVVTTVIAQGPGTNAKASLIHPLPMAGPANIFFSTEAKERRVGNLCQTAQNLIFSLPWSPKPQPKSICHSTCQSCLKPPLRQGAREVHSTSGISDTECAHLRTELH